MAYKKLSAIIKERDTLIRETGQRTLLIAGTDIADDFRGAVSNWTNKPSFRPKLSYDRTFYQVTVFPSGKGEKIFKYVDLGTGLWGKHHRKYPIPKIIVPGKYLRFQTGYSAKTAPIARGNVGNGARFGNWVTKVQVMHPGIEPREFSRQFLEDLTPSLKERLDSALKRSLT